MLDQFLWGHSSCVCDISCFFVDKSPLERIPTCVTWQPGQDHVFGVGNESGQIVVKDTRAAVCSTVSFNPHNRPVKRIQFSPYKYASPVLSNTLLRVQCSSFIRPNTKNTCV